jgi:hypothetical protein
MGEFPIRSHHNKRWASFPFSCVWGTIGIRLVQAFFMIWACILPRKFSMTWCDGLFCLARRSAAIYAPTVTLIFS